MKLSQTLTDPQMLVSEEDITEDDLEQVGLQYTLPSLQGQVLSRQTNDVIFIERRGTSFLYRIFLPGYIVVTVPQMVVDLWLREKVKRMGPKKKVVWCEGPPVQSLRFPVLNLQWYVCFCDTSIKH